MKAPTIEELKAQFTELGYKWPSIHVVGIRSKANEPNKFDDLIGLVQGDQVNWYTGTTNPGTFWLNSPMNSLGTAVLKCGQYVDTYVIGLHQGKYTALKQAKKVTVFRDADKDSVAEEQGKEDTGLFGITNKHVYFSGNETGFRIKLDKIVSTQPYDDGIGILKDGVRAKPLIFKTGDGWFTFNLIQNLTKL